nr:unnamed protein product [Callosobruchus chinensis]
MGQLGTTLSKPIENPADPQIQEKIDAHSLAVKTDDEKSLLYETNKDQAKQIALQTAQSTALQRQIEKLTSQIRATRLIGDLTLTCHLQPLSHRCGVGDLSIFYRYSNGVCSSELTSIIPPLPGL